MIGVPSAVRTAIEAIPQTQSCLFDGGRWERLIWFQGHSQISHRCFCRPRMEAIYEFEVQDMPVTVAVDALGESMHLTAPKISKEIGLIPVAE